MGLDVLNAAGVELDDSELVVQRADEINRLHGEIVGALRTSVEAAVRIGKLLSEQKAELAHGEWLPWIEANLPFTDRTAQKYMRVYEGRPALPEGKSEPGSDLSLTAAYRAIGVLAEPSEPDPEPEAEPPAPKREVLIPEVVPPEPPARERTAKGVKAARGSGGVVPKMPRTAEAPSETSAVDRACDLVKRAAEELRPLRVQGFRAGSLARLRGAVELFCDAFGDEPAERHKEGA